MKHLYNFDDLKAYGINPLTGEACAYSQRILCDLSEAGCSLVRDFFGLACDGGVGLAKNWNSRVGDDPAIASIMLTHNTIHDLMLFALLHVERCNVVIAPDGGGFCGLHFDDPYYKGHMELAEKETFKGRVYRNYANRSGQPSVNGRNVHAMSGRAE